MLGRTEHDLRADAPGRAQPSRGPRARRAARARAAHRPAPVLRAREALRARRRPRHPRARRTSSLMHGDGERPLYFLCQLVDVSERRRAEAERRAGEAAPAGDHRQLAGAHHRQGPPAALPAGQPPLGGALRHLRRAGARAHRPRGAARPTPTRATTSSTDEVAAAGERSEEMTTISVGDESHELTLFVVKFPLRDADGRSTRSARSRPTSPSAAARPTSASSSSIAWRRRSGWRASASSRAASRTTSTTCSR